MRERHVEEHGVVARRPPGVAPEGGDRGGYKLVDRRRYGALLIRLPVLCVAVDREVVLAPPFVVVLRQTLVRQHAQRIGRRRPCLVGPGGSQADNAPRCRV
jgi:hypothetical protein